MRCFGAYEVGRNLDARHEVVHQNLAFPVHLPGRFAYGLPGAAVRR